MRFSEKKVILPVSQNLRELSRKSVECCLANKDEEQQQATKAATKARFNKYSIFSNYRTI